MSSPASLSYTKNHEWVRVEDDSRVITVGITDYAQAELGDIIFVELEPVDEAYGKDEVFGSVEAVKAVSDLFMPVSGTVLVHNERLEDNPELVNSDPYGKGWMVKIRLSDPSELADLLSADDYADLVG